MNKILNISLRAIDTVKPDKFFSSDEIEKQLSPVYDRLKLPYGRIEMQTGIKSRGVFIDKRPSDISAMAAKNLFKNSNINPDDIDLLIHASVCRDFLEPSTASVVHDLLGLRSDCLSFDLSNACLGVVSAISVAADMLQQESVKKALIVTGENSGPLLKTTIETILKDKSMTRKTIKKYFANFTIGSSGVALVLEKENVELPTFKEFISLSDTSANKLCQGDGSTDSLVMETDSEALKVKGVDLAKTCWKEFYGQTKVNFDHFICHQVGIHHRDYLYNELGLDLKKDHTSFDEYGNTGSAALPLTLALSAKKNLFGKGENLALLGIGSGIHTHMLRLEWN